MTNKIIIFDTTLRDGDQAPGFHFSIQEKVRMAQQLYKLGVDIIEVGFPKSSGGDFEAARQISELFSMYGPIICGLSRAVDGDIDQVAEATKRARRRRIHTFIATSDWHIKDKLNSTREKVIAKAVNAVRRAREYTDDVEFSCEDFSRSDLDYIVDVTSEVIRAGAITINLPDTVGFASPEEMKYSISYVIDRVRARELEAVFSVHNHNDLGLATANTLAGVAGGARQVEVTVNGIGERAGNAALEEVVMAMKVKKIGECGIKTEYLTETSKMCQDFTGSPCQRNKAIVGDNAFAHEAGIHVDGVLKNKNNYEIMPPEMIGAETKIVYGSRIGMNGLKWVYSIRGIDLDGQIESVYREFKRIADVKKNPDEKDLIKALEMAGVCSEGFRFIEKRT
jgi:2-isopropylmalate synthase